MWRCLVLSIAISCGEPQRTPATNPFAPFLPVAPAAPVAQWWCIDKLRVCQSSRENCDKITSFANSRLPAQRLGCVAQPKAWCKQSCFTEGGMTACPWQCAVDAAECEKMKLAENFQLEVGCRERTPPKHPDAFPNHFEPGWWCSETPRADGAILSNCMKTRRVCEGALDLILMQAGLTRTTVPGVEGRIDCKQASRAWCSTMKVETELLDQTNFTCARTPAHCDQVLRELKAQATDGAIPVSKFKLKLSDRCEEWTYD